MSKIVKTLKNSGVTVIGYCCDGCRQRYESYYDLKEVEHYGWITVEDKHYCNNCKGETLMEERKSQGLYHEYVSPEDFKIAKEKK